MAAGALTFAFKKILLIDAPGFCAANREPIVALETKILCNPI